MFVMAAFVRVVAMAAALAAANAAMMAGGPSGASVEEAATARIQATSRGCPVRIPPTSSPSLFPTFRGW